MRKIEVVGSVASCLLVALSSVRAGASESVAVFEAGQVRPIALSPSGRTLVAVNTPDNRLEVFKFQGRNLQHRASIPVGLEPVAVAARNDKEVWVVNHLSDSVSVVALDGSGAGQVVRTLLVGDEPRDVVFAGSNRERAFITTAHRGQNTRRDPQLTTPGVGRADVWVFDVGALGRTLEGEPTTVISLFTDTPRALEVSPDGSRVYAAGFHTGNQTTSLVETRVPNGFGADGAPGPQVNASQRPAPEIGVIVKYDGEQWRDLLGRSWTDSVRFNLPDRDVFVIDAMAEPPRVLEGQAGFYAGVGTILYNLAVNPVTGVVYASNTDAQNLLRGEGPGSFAGDALHGRLHLNRITVLREGDVAPRHLNKHIDYFECCEPLPNAESEASLALPTSMAVTRDGRTLYVAALGSSKVGVFDTFELEQDLFDPSPASHIELSGGGPTGLALDEPRNRLYVLTRFDNSVTLVDTRTRREVGKIPLFNPEPAHVVTGRRVLYDARNTSSHGDQACASCHVFGDVDSLAWDLSNPDAETLNNPGPFIAPLFNPIIGQEVDPTHHPIKGPMVTQSLRGLANHGPMHWRGDRTGGNDAPNAQPDSGAFDERAALRQFQVAFPDLLRRDTPISDAEMEDLIDYILEITYPPSPIRNLDNSLTAEQAAGRDYFFNRPASDGITSCAGCHVTDPHANSGFTKYPGFFGTDGSSAFDFIPQIMKVPHLRNLYHKVGMFGMSEAEGILPGNNQHMGDQIRGFGFSHDGSFDTTFRFHSVLLFAQSPQFNPNGFPPGPEGDLLRRQVDAFLLAFDTNMAPIVGQQVTLSRGASSAFQERVDLLEQRSALGECDLAAHWSTPSGTIRGFLYLGDGRYARDARGEAPLASASLRALAERGQSFVTFTCAPPGTGYRIALDRDDDGVLDQNDLRCE